MLASKAWCRRSGNSTSKNAVDVDAGAEWPKVAWRMSLVTSDKTPT